jgi:PhnB protein
MKAFQPYLNFDGQTREAMTFYHQCLGGDLSIQTFGDVKAPGPPGLENRVMHAAITNGPAILMASDTMPGMQFTKGNNIHVNVDCESLEEIERVFKALAAGGTVTMPLQDQFWGARFGMLIDKFGLNWMFNYQLPNKA